MTPAAVPRRLTLDDPAPLLRWLATRPLHVQLGAFDVAEIWSLVALATLGRREQAWLKVEADSDSATSRFAYAVGLDDVIAGVAHWTPGQTGRTVKISRVTSPTQIEPLAHDVANLLLHPAEESEDVRRTLSYVIIELLRNVVQHSRDACGGVVAAQLNDRGRNTDRPMVQVAVGDAGIGIFESLKRLHPTLDSARAALEKALWPHISGTFEEGQTGSAENAGMGLFFIAEMTKLVSGTLMIASRDATLVLRGDPEGTRHDQSFLDPGLGFAGTLVAFEMPAYEAIAYDAMIETIRTKAAERTPRRQTNRWLAAGAAPPNAARFIVRVAAEDTQKALALGQQLKKVLVDGRPVALDFSGVTVCTQSFVHALLFEAIRVAWALKVPIHVSNVAPAVKSTLELLENYALSG